MDPNRTLQDMRDEIMNQRDLEINDLDFDAYGVDRLMDNFEALDQWLSKGGYLPDSWSNQNGGS